MIAGNLNSSAVNTFFMVRRFAPQTGWLSHSGSHTLSNDIKWRAPCYEKALHHEVLTSSRPTEFACEIQDTRS